MRADVLGVLRQAGTTSILVTHDQDEALSMADQVAVLRHGVIAQLDTPAGLYGHPGDAALAQFLGESNVLEGEVRDGLADARRWAGSPVAIVVRPVGGRPGPGHGPARADRARRASGEGIVAATVQSYEYYGHDAVVRVRPDGSEGLPELVVRVTGGAPLEPGLRVGLSVRGPVVAWPADARPNRENSPE